MQTGVTSVTNNISGLSAVHPDVVLIGHDRWLERRTKKCISANGGGGRGGCGVCVGGRGGELEWRTDVIHITYNTQNYKLERDKSISKQRRRRTKTNTNTEHDVHRVTRRHR